MPVMLHEAIVRAKAKDKKEFGGDRGLQSEIHISACAFELDADVQKARSIAARIKILELAFGVKLS